MTGRGPLSHLDRSLADLARQNLLRDDAHRPANLDILDVCSNDYLGYAKLPIAGLAPGGAGASRLIAGDHAAHLDAEAALARWVGAESALIFTSGYAANVGALAALAGPGDLIVSDELNHASIIDGCRLGRADVVVVPHDRPEAVEAALRRSNPSQRRWVVTESVFSMEGEVADVVALRRICDQHDAGLYVDEAHGLGVLGPEGAGACRARGVAPDVLVGTLGKAVGLQGAFVAGSRTLRKWLWNRARSFVYSTGLSPAIAAALPDRVAKLRSGEPARERMRHVAHALRSAFVEAGATVGGAAEVPILPWRLGAADRALSAAHALLDLGVRAQPIRPPTVPAGSARLRITASAALSEAELDRVARAIMTVAARFA